MKTAIITFLTLAASTTVSCYCHSDKLPIRHGIGNCSYDVQCIEIIKAVKLDRKCQGSANVDVKIDVTLRNATDTFHLNSDPDFLSKVTTLTVFSNWPRTDLSFLDSMYRLRNLHLSYSKIQKINDSPFRNLINLENIDLSHNSISEIEELFQFEIRPSKMRRLSLAYNLIQDVPGDTFEALTSLQELDLSYNFIEELSEEPFLNLTNLISLKLNNNKIIDLNGAMNNLVNLQHLNLRHNQIENIDMESIKTINHLQTFDISDNKIEDVEPRVFLRHWNHYNNTILRMILSGNNIKVLLNGTNIFDRFKSNSSERLLTQIDLSKNAISHIEYNAFQYIYKLDTLDLSNNKLISFYVNSEHLMYVKYLNLSCNYLSRLYYESFALMHNLQNLDLSRNEMEYFPDQSLSNTFMLKYVNVTYNDIVEVHSLRINFHHTEGGVLDLSNNGLSTLTIPENEALGLTELILNSNNITDPYLIRLTDHRDLTKLHMSKNFIQELDESSLQLPIKLGYLDLSYNEIQVIGPSAFHRLPNLQTLRLSYNRIRTIEYGVFRGLTMLVNLNLAYNQIGYLDSKVFMDLKSLSVLSLRHNGLNVFERDSWLTHKHFLKVYLDDNNLSCDWLATALNDYHSGYSKMLPAVLDPSVSGHSIEGIPCKQEVGNLAETPSKYIMDERLLITSQKILEAVQNQTLSMRQYIWYSLRQNAALKEAMEQNMKNLTNSVKNKNM